MRNFIQALIDDRAFDYIGNYGFSEMSSYEAIEIMRELIYQFDHADNYEELKAALVETLEEMLDEEDV